MFVLGLLAPDSSVQIQREKELHKFFNKFKDRWGSPRLKSEEDGFHFSHYGLSGIAC